jgi:hypothetical protein
MGSILGYVSPYFNNSQNLSAVTLLIFVLLFALQSLYTLFFWITLRQFMQERFERRNTSALEDMAAPLQITVGPATRGETDIW